MSVFPRPDIENKYVPDPYVKEWKEIRSLVDSGLYRQADSSLKLLRVRAGREGVKVYILKTTFARISMMNQLSETPLNDAFTLLNDEIRQNPSPLKQLLESVKGSLLMDHLDQSGWDLANRTPGAADTLHPETWDTQFLRNQAVACFLRSIQQKEDLQKENLSEFSLVLDELQASRKYRPTLYDLLAFRAVEFLGNERSYLLEPAEVKELNKPEYFSVDGGFLRQSLPLEVKEESRIIALRMYQEIEAFHRNDSKKDAYLDAISGRLDFVFRSYTGEDKNLLYQRALEQMVASYPAHPYTANFRADLANQMTADAQNWNAEDPMNNSDSLRYLLRDARAVCIACEQAGGDSIGLSSCRYRRQEIEKPEHSLNTEAVVLPEQPSLARISWKNTRKVWFRILKIKPEDKFRSYYFEDRVFVNRFLSRQPIDTWSADLPAEEDYRFHSAEIRIPALPFGNYAILSSLNEDFRPEDNSVSVSFFQVSRFSWTSTRTVNGIGEVFVTERESGKPLQNVQVEGIRENADYQEGKVEYQSFWTRTTDEKGKVIIPPIKTPGSGYYELSSIQITQGKDVLFEPGEGPGPSWNRNKEVPRKQATFFLDRKIFRPGQTVFFKGLIYEGTTNQFHIVSNQKVTVRFSDPNGQEKGTQEFRTNEFGTFNGSFVTPAEGITGNWMLRCEFGSDNFKVEEYKRPRFEVAFFPAAGNYRLNDKIEIQGKAADYSGAVVDQAKVTYRVVRNASFPFYCWEWGRMPHVSQKEISSGVTQTAADGSFRISFTALADPSIPSKLSPLFDYTVYADVSDATGETHSAETAVEVGYTAVNVKLNLPESLHQNDFRGLPVTVQNLAGQPVLAPLKASITPLQAPRGLLRQRNWDVPDRFLIPEAEFIRDFPHDAYRNENIKENWPSAGQTYSQEYQIKGTDTLSIPGMEEPVPGFYKINIEARDSFGGKVNLTDYFWVLPAKEGPFLHPEAFICELTKNTCQPGEEARVYIASGYAGMQVRLDVISGNEILHREWLEAGQKGIWFRYPVTEVHRGGFFIRATAVREGRIYSEMVHVDVPWTNKQLNISLETFRDKLQPGAKEEWRISIKGQRKDPVLAELLAAMYDASLDAFYPGNWYFHAFVPASMGFSFPSGGTGTGDFMNLVSYESKAKLLPPRMYEKIDASGFHWSSVYLSGFGGRRAYASFNGSSEADSMMAVEINFGTESEEVEVSGKKGADKRDEKYKEAKPAEPPLTTMKPDPGDNQEASGESVQVRKNLNETAFFCPEIRTDSSGNVILAFTMPEALTKWKLQLFAHSKDLSTGLLSKEVQTQKELMIRPNLPRFFREGDKISITAKISNMAEYDLQGFAYLDITDAASGASLIEKFEVSEPRQPFTAAKSQSTGLHWDVYVKPNQGPVTVRMTARAENFTDGEETMLPVLSNRVLVTETLPLWTRPRQTKEFHFTRLSQAQSGTLKQHKFTLEYTSNPAWYAVQSLPYLAEFPHECAEQLFSRLYANQLASHMANSQPRIREVFEKWADAGPEALASALEKNQDLKSAILEETPWVMEAKNESARKQNVALLFNLHRIAKERERAIMKLKAAQSNSGAWPWFKGMDDSRYITQHIVTGFGKLIHLGALDLKSENRIQDMVRSGIIYLDQQLCRDYQDALRRNVDWNKTGISSEQLHFLYCRSFYPDIPVSGELEKAVTQYHILAKRDWKQRNLYEKAMLAVTLLRSGDKPGADLILNSLKDVAIRSEEMGMYWVDNRSGWYWYEAPVETQAMLIEAFSEWNADPGLIEEMKLWLLKQKQTSDWKTTRATTEACYALLMRGLNLLAESQPAEITVGAEVLNPASLELEAGTGYFRKDWSPENISAELSTIRITNPNAVASWGAAYWQYFEDMDKVTAQNTSLQIKKGLFIQENSPTGPVLKTFAEHPPQPGDLVKVRIEIRSDRDLEYVHLKDMRPSGFEPVNVLSEYRWQDGMGYYESTRDLASHFFISWLTKGTHVFEYPLRVVHAGTYSAGISTIQCMYAPEFAAHSAGEKITVK